MFEGKNQINYLQLATHLFLFENPFFSHLIAIRAPGSTWSCVFRRPGLHLVKCFFCKHLIALQAPCRSKLNRWDFHVANFKRVLAISVTRPLTWSWAFMKCSTLEELSREFSKILAVIGSYSNIFSVMAMRKTF